MRNKIIEYRVVEADRPCRLEKEIRNAISAGWQPLGDVMYYGNWFYQAVVKYEDVEEECCGSCRWFKYLEPACTAGRCYALPDKVELNSYVPCCSLYAHKDHQ